jgi:sigma-E factor negative regulatory protein RseB
MAAGLFFLAQASSSLADGSDTEVHDWLKRMVESVHTLNYDGTFVYLHDNHMETMRVIHAVHDNDEHERLISLNGAARQVIRDNASVTCVTPDSKSISIGKRMLGQGFRAVFSADTRELADFYEFSMIGESRVADRKTKVFAIIPKDNYRYGYRIYLDVENALPLKTDMLDSEGVAVSQIMFTSLRIENSIASESESYLDGKENYRWNQEKPNSPLGESGSSWTFRQLPNGFKKIYHTKKSSSKGREDVDHLVLSDGLATLSVYIEDRSLGNVLTGASRMGAVNAFGIQLSGHHVTVVGEVPALTVESVANSLLPAHQ